MEFYNVFKFNGTYGVNKLTLMDLLGVQIVSLLIYIVLVALLGLIAPTLLFGFYVLWMMFGNGTQGYDGQAVAQRLYINIFTVISVIYFLLDFHFGWLIYRILGSVIDKESFDAIASFNVTIALVSTVMFFLGHELYRIGRVWIVRILLFSFMIYMAFKFFSPIGDYIVTELITQSTIEFLVER